MTNRGIVIKSILPMLKTRLFLALLLLSLYTSGQTDISGVVNSYYRVIEIIPSKACVRLNTTAGLNISDKVMLVQMKGASIDVSSSSSASFGDTISLNNAGNYEIGTICYLQSDSVFFIYNILNQYTVSASVQLVRIPQYFSARVIDTLKAAPWNSATGTGGVLAVYVEQDLILNAPISADSAGYRGGTYKVSNSTCFNSPFAATSYAYNPTSTTQNGAYKGEGVADITNIAQAGGRGAPANGGGGGNNHNNGGAGGANLTAGGDGGSNSSSSGCTTPLPGIGGKALSNYGGKKIFMGGGGGAGHTNNGPAVSKGGGHGGGIIFIRANTVVGNGYKISANGQTGGPAASDGASGGGAGGTLIMSTTIYSGAVTIEANGGTGGTEDDGLNINYCYGSGGGGSGGVIYYSGATPGSPVVTNRNGGGAGPEINHDVSCAAAIPSFAGTAGVITPSYNYASSMSLATNNCSIPLAAEQVSLNVHYTNNQTILRWTVLNPGDIDYFIIEKSNDGGNWSSIASQEVINNMMNYKGIDRFPAAGFTYYRIKAVKKNNGIIYSRVQRALIAGKNELISIYPNPASGKIFITGMSAVADLSLSDLSGKMLVQKRITSAQGHAEFELPLLPSGIYIIKIGETVKRLTIY